jgi:VIT1/CCC1 family predicted Fe2+/Mn2+ transporter
MARSATLRASDADREAVADRLRTAAGEGRLEPDELEERLHVALRSRTYGDLRRLVADLPAKSSSRGTAVLPTARLLLAVAVRIAFVLAAVAAVVTFAAVMTAWWILWVLVVVALRARGSCWNGSAAWRPPRPRRVL